MPLDVSGRGSGLQQVETRLGDQDGCLRPTSSKGQRFAEATPAPTPRCLEAAIPPRKARAPDAADPPCGVMGL